MKGPGGAADAESPLGAGRSPVGRVNEYAALFQFTDRLYRAESLSDVYEAALDAILDALDCQRASILLFDASGVMKFAASRGLSDFYCKAVEGHSPWRQGQRAPDPICISNIDETDEPEFLKETIKREGIRALAFIPLTANGMVIGKSMTYYEAVHRFSAQELDRSLTIARQLGFSLERTRSEEARRSIEDELHRERELLKIEVEQRRRAQEQQQLLLLEMDHRIKNLFALSSSIVTLSARSAKTPQELAMAVERLVALARAHSLTRAQFSKDAVQAEQRTMLHALIRTIIAPYDTADMSRIVLRGPNIPVSGAALAALALLLHEFATNATKYGALSVETGAVDVRCAEEGNRFTLTWRERGGPRIDIGPRREGFGSLLARTVERELGGEIVKDWKPEGLTIWLTVARDRIAT
jgi:two-component sensor histidine kinase